MKHFQSGSFVYVHCARELRKIRVMIFTWTGAIFSVVSSKLLKHLVIFSSKVETKSSRDPLKFSLKLSTKADPEAEAFAGRLSTSEAGEEEEEETGGVVLEDGSVASTSLSLAEVNT